MQPPFPFFCDMLTWGAYQSHVFAWYRVREVIKYFENQEVVNV